MRLANWKDREAVIDIISERFHDNPGSVWILREGVNRNKAIRCLASYVFIKAFNRDGAYISDNGMGMALCYRYNRRVFSIRETACLLKLAVLYGSIRRIREISYREKYREQKRPADGNYLYWWFFGVKKGGRSAGFEIAREIINVSSENKLPIYLETAMERNMKVYSRYGYQLFHHWEEKDKKIEFWFMKREPDQL